MIKLVRTVVALGALAAPLAVLPAPVSAATAHNSQSGGMGNTSNSAAPGGMTRRMKSMSHHSRKMHRGRMMHHKSM